MSYSTLLDPRTGAPLAHAIRRDVDDAIVPDDPLNIDWQAYQSWLDAGNTPAVPDTMSAA